MVKRVLSIVLGVFALSAGPVGAAPAHPPARVIVLATLHGLHAQVPAYDFDTLGHVIEGLKPDVLCLEVRPRDLDVRGPERTKQEYPRVIYPLIARHHYRLYALEPSEPLFSDIVKPYVASAQAFQKQHPEQAAAFDAYNETTLRTMQRYWTSPRRVNDATTDAAFAAKHALQQSWFGDGERAGWQAWNRHFLSVILRAARENPGRTIVVTVGVEHTYWLRRHLRHQPGITLVDTARLMPTH